MFTLNCKVKLLLTGKPLVMGILNMTPDSFYEGHLQKDISTIVSMAGQMLDDGADILDIGGQSSRPGSTRISAAEEAGRIIPVIEALHKNFPEAVLSVDTYYSLVAKEAVAAGASIINDISAGEMDTNMIAAVGQLKVPYIVTHMQGRPETMQQQPEYKNIITDILDYFIQKIDCCQKAGITDIILDPGFGFGKTLAHNFQILKHLSIFSMLEKPILAGISRKSMICNTLNITPAEALNGTSCLNTIALLNGASLLRVHDVKEAVQNIQLLQEYQSAQ